MKFSHEFFKNELHDDSRSFLEKKYQFSKFYFKLCFIITNTRIYPLFRGILLFLSQKSDPVKIFQIPLYPLEKPFFLRYTFLNLFKKLICDFRMNKTANITQKSNSNIAKFAKQNIHYYNRFIIKTLRAILIIKCNLSYSCLEFYKFLKTKPELLGKLGGKETNIIKKLEVVELMSSRV